MNFKLVTTCNKNELQQDAKSNAQLQAKWTVKSWKTFEETIRRDRNRSIKAEIVTDDDDDNGGGGDDDMY